MQVLCWVRQLRSHRALILSLVVTLLILGVSLRGFAQDFPGQNDPIANPSRLTQFPDDELAIISFSPSKDNASDPNKVSVRIQEFSPKTDYTMLAGPTSTDLNPWPEPSGEENIFSNAGISKGRFSDPSRDALVALTKTSVDRAENTITWAVQELTFAGGPAGTVPTLTFTASVVPSIDPNTKFPLRSADSPGAIAGGDLDRAVDKDGNYHDEIAIVTEDYPGGPATEVMLSVIDYAVKPGAATVNATVTGLPGGHMAYPLNISTLRKYKDKSGQQVQGEGRKSRQRAGRRESQPQWYRGVPRNPGLVHRHPHPVATAQ